MWLLSYCLGFFIFAKITKKLYRYSIFCQNLQNINGREYFADYYGKDKSRAIQLRSCLYKDCVKLHVVYFTTTFLPLWM